MTRPHTLLLSEQQDLTESVRQVIERKPGLTRPEIAELAALPNHRVRTALGWLAKTGKVCFKGPEKRYYVIRRDGKRTFLHKAKR